MPALRGADALRGVPLSDTPLADGQGYAFNNTTGEIEPVDLASVGGLVFQDNWNAATNTPDLTTSPPDEGKFWRVSVAGSTDLGGLTDWGVGDWAVSKGSGAWIKVDNTDSVVSVNTQVGTVVLDADDISDAATANKFATASELADIGSNTSARHNQGTDLGLDTGGSNPITAATAKGHVDDVSSNPHAVTAAQAGAEPAFAKNGAFNKNFGSSAGTVAQGNDPRLSDARTPTGAAGGDLGGTYPDPTVDDGADSTAIHDNESGEIVLVPEKTSPVAADLVLIEDSAATNAKKRVQIGNLVAMDSRLIAPIATPAQLTATTHDWNPTGLTTARLLRISSNANRDVTGIVAQPANTAVYLVNIGTSDVKLKKENTGSVAANRFAIKADLTIMESQVAQIWYDGTSSRWRVISDQQN